MCRSASGVPALRSPKRMISSRITSLMKWSCAGVMRLRSSSSCANVSVGMKRSVNISSIVSVSAWRSAMAMAPVRSRVSSRL